ncbi:MAG: hypothetical protein GXP31_13450 [Kiritimatiellaeota bacterium]|nr:hypothetical protein [Kiritimatiellota bacterium]
MRMPWNAALAGRFVSPVPGLRLSGAARIVAMTVVVGSLHRALYAGDNRFRFAAAEQWGEKRGFYLNLENKTEGNVPCTPATLRLILGVADGRQWRFLIAQPQWQFDRDYTVRAAILSDRAELWLDGRRVAESAGGFVPGQPRLSACEVPSWGNAPANYMIVQKELHLRTGTGKKRDEVFPDRASLPMGLLMFQPQTARRFDWDVTEGDSVWVQVRFRLIRRPALKELAPFIDKFGQCRYADWPGKVDAEGEFRTDISSEETQLAHMPPSKDFDPYGGWKRAPWRERPSGFFHVVRRKRFWWLVSPLGYPCFYVGMNSIPSSTWPQTPVSGRRFIFEWLPPKTGVWKAAWGRNHWGRNDGDYVCFQACNLIRKYGEDEWQERATVQGVRRVRCWGFSGGGKWGAPNGIVSTPVLSLAGVPKLARHPDVFDPAIRKRIREVLARQITARKSDPFVLGWSIGNEYDEIISRQEIRDMLAQPRLTPARRAMVDYAFEQIYRRDVSVMARGWQMKANERSSLYVLSPKPPEKDVEKLRRFFADRYYETLYKTVKSIDPKHLYLGFWIAFDWWENEEDWRLIARHCDVIGHDRYTLEYVAPRFRRLVKETDKPILWGEFSVPPNYDGRRGFGQYNVSAESEAQAGRYYTRLVRQAARDPWCVGAMWFQYRDQPLTGRGPGHGERLVFGEHFAFGVVTVTDRPKWPLVRLMRQANLAAAVWRSAATAASVP